MSPAGVPLLYVADSANTALAETASGCSLAAVAEFEVSRPLRVLDLTAVPEVPSLFDLPRASSRQVISFLRDFAADVARPYPKDGRDRIEYVPSQVITEYMRFIFKPAGAAIKGIKYPSAQAPGGANLGLFLSPADLQSSGALRVVEVRQFVSANLGRQGL
jgi:RES domain-containing protein